MRRIFKTVEYDTHPDYVTIREMLKSYQRTGDNRNWDTFRQKIPDDILSIWSEILRDCKRNGFIAPFANEDRITWKQILATNNQPADLCTLCDKECQLREDRDNGVNKLKKLADPNFEEAKPCWIKELPF